MEVKIYGDRLSQPVRAVLIFCKVNGIEFEEIEISLARQQQFTRQYKELNPMGKMPTIVHGNYKLFESHAILIYIACSFPGIAEHWYPSDILKRAKIHSVLDWHHSNLRQGLASYVLSSRFAPYVGAQLNPNVARVAEKLMLKSLAKIESFWLKGEGQFFFGNFQPSIADLSLVCEIMQLELMPDNDRDRILSPHKKVRQWIVATKNATKPHFDEMHATLFKLKEQLTEKSSPVEKIESDHNNGTGLLSKI